MLRQRSIAIRRFVGPHATQRLQSSSSMAASMAGGDPSVVPAPLKEGVVRADYRRFCAEQNVSMLAGVPTAAFVRYLERVRKAGPTAELQLRDMGCFAFNGPRVALASTDGDESPLAYEDELKKFALSLPVEGLPADEIKAKLMRDLPAFTPKLVGAVTVRDVFTRFSHLFQITRGGDTWIVKSVVRPSTPVGAAALPGARATTDAATTAGDESAPPVMLAEDKLIRTVDAALLEAYAERTARRGLKGSEWLDVEPLLRGVDARLRSQIASWAATVPQLPSFDVHAELVVRPVRRPRAAHVFVDGDGLTAHHLDVMTSRFRVAAATATTTVMRQASTPALTADDIVTPMDMPTYMALEAAAEKLRRSHHIVLRDVVFMCCDARADMYVEQVAKAVPFPDAEVYVLTPTREVLVASWKERHHGSS
jgi:hypothetical protein